MENKESCQKSEVKGYRAIRKTFSDFRKNFTQGTGAIADAILDRSVMGKKEKLSKVRSASWKMMKDLFSGLNRDMKEVGVMDVMADTSYQIGKVSAVAKCAGAKVWDRLMEKLDEDKS